MYKKTIFIVPALLCLYASGFGQNIKPLSIGDTVPDMVLHHVINYKDSVIRLSDFKEKPVIIDFFATWCSSCIAALPHLDSLQRKFGDSIRVFAVSNEPKEKLLSFLKRNKTGKTVTTVFITNDSLLEKYFPHKLIPHEVIINRGRVVAITFPEYIDIRFIRDLKIGKDVSLPLKKDVTAFNRKNPLLPDNLFNSRIVSASIISRYVSGLSGMSGKAYNSDSSLKRIFFINTGILPMILTAARQPLNRYNRVVLHIKDKEKLIPLSVSGQEEWAQKNCFCYERTEPVFVSDSAIYDYMLDDICRYMHLSVSREITETDCLALVRDSSKACFKPGNGNVRPMLQIDADSSVKRLINVPLSTFTDILNSRLPAVPMPPIVLNETGYRGNITMELRIAELFDMPALSEALLNYGLALKKVRRKIEVFTITDQSGTTKY